MLRGEFTRGDGLVVTNNITTWGASQLLEMALRDSAATLFVGLVRGFPTKAGGISSLVEPTIGANGYARQSIARSNVGWPTAGTLNGSAFLETDFKVWTPSGPGFNQAINRLMLCTSVNDLSGNYIALSATLPEEVILLPATSLEQRRWKYKVYLG